MSISQARRECLLADSYTRLEVVMRWSPATRYDFPKLRADLWWRLLGETWPSCDNIAEWATVLRAMLASAPRRQVKQMMTSAEHEALDQLPSEFTVWRGCYEGNADGLSWTIKKAIATRFPFQHRYRRKAMTPILIEAHCRRDDAILKLDRGEAEVIAHRVRVVQVTELDEVACEHLN